MSPQIIWTTVFTQIIACNSYLDNLENPKLHLRIQVYLNDILYIVACHLPRGSKLRWPEVMGGGLPSARELHVG